MMKLGKNTRCNITYTTYSDEEIFNQRLFNVFVFSIARCGSSMMTRILEKLGVNMVYTSEDVSDKEKRKESYEKSLGEYVPNSFFGEITKDVWSHQLEILNTPYSGCKVIMPVMGQRLGLMKECPCKVIMMWRDPEEIRQSQVAFYRRSPEVEYFEGVMAAQEVALTEGGIDFKVVKFQDVIDNPVDTISDVAAYINSPNNIADAVASVDKKAKRFNKPELVEGI